ncbi:hypothetical protein GCM10009624_10410 [Gordonia sinesedis]
MTVVSTARDTCALLPREPGVYRFRDERQRVIYLGRATDLRARTRSYWGNVGSRRHLRRMVPRIASVEAMVCGSVHEAMWLERNLLERTLPGWNRARGGQEVPAWLVLTTDPRCPRLDVVTVRPAATQEAFGPYLGVVKARLVQRALTRLWPLHLTGAGSASAGGRMSSAAVSFAELRGVSGTDAAGFADRIRRVLTRAPDVCAEAHAALEGLRDLAAGRLAFEAAHEIQEELEALAWATAPQRVLDTQPQDLTVRGWHDGMLFVLKAHRGVFNTWTLRRMPEERGRALAGRTPDHWHAFAARNAALSAELAAAQAR